FVLFAPAVLLAIAAILWTFGVRGTSRDLGARSWMILAATLLLGGLAAPDSFGAEHGGFLRERLFLLGAAAMTVAWPLSPSRGTRVATALAAIALAVQSAFVWEYALRSHREIARLMRAHGAIPDRARVFVAAPLRREKFEASATRHAANLLGVDRAIVIWNNYQANLYYFPVNFHRPFIRCSVDGTCELRENGDRIDAVVFWDVRPSADHAVRSSFERRFESADVAVYQRRR
ncbi:MAG TPA: hypothetical protein VIL97_03020, partial [Thermoanaerobaculia bacterium]